MKDPKKVFLTQDQETDWAPFFARPCGLLKTVPYMQRELSFHPGRIKTGRNESDQIRPLTGQAGEWVARCGGGGHSKMAQKRS